MDPRGHVVAQPLAPTTPLVYPVAVMQSLVSVLHSLKSIGQGSLSHFLGVPASYSLFKSSSDMSDAARQQSGYLAHSSGYVVTSITDANPWAIYDLLRVRTVSIWFHSQPILIYGALF